MGTSSGVRSGGWITGVGVEISLLGSGGAAGSSLLCGILSGIPTLVIRGSISGFAISLFKIT